MYAAAGGNREIARELIQSGADLDLQDNVGGRGGRGAAMPQLAYMVHSMTEVRVESDVM